MSLADELKADHRALLAQPRAAQRVSADRAFKLLAKRLRSRISEEESFLYAEYDRLGLE